MAVLTAAPGAVPGDETASQDPDSPGPDSRGHDSQGHDYQGLGRAVGSVTVRYWAAARAAAGVASDSVDLDGPTPLAEILAEVRRRHAGTARFGEVAAVCSVLVGDTPVSARDPERVVVHPGDGVELLPPFAGG